jgi:hypothetical protein
MNLSIEEKRRRHREANRRWEKNHREERLKYKREYRIKYPEKHRNYSREWYRNNIEKFRAELIAWRKTPLNTNCSKCGSTTSLERHHLDYSKPLGIITLCKSCHKIEHGGIRN